MRSTVVTGMSGLYIAKQRNAEREGYSTRKNRMLFENLTCRLITFDRNVECDDWITRAVTGHFTAIM